MLSMCYTSTTRGKLILAGKGSEENYEWKERYKTTKKKKWHKKNQAGLKYTAILGLVPQ